MNGITTILLIFLTFLKNTCLHDHECPSVKNEKLGIEWPSTKDKTISYPPCVNEAREFAYRTCEDGKWGPEPYCYYVQPKSPPQCPEDFIQYNVSPNNETICYKITEEKRAFPPKCPFESTLPFKAYISSLQFTGSVWMPVHKKKFDYFRWTEASFFYKDPLPDSDYTLNGSLTDKNCLVYENGQAATAVSCSEKHSSFCAYKSFNDISNAFCDVKSDCFQSDFSPISKCWCLNWDTLDMAPLVEILKPYQNNIFEKSLTDDAMCLVGFKKYQDGSYRWISSGQELNYTYWSKDAVFNFNYKEFVNGAATAQGWTLINFEPCFWVEKSITVPEPQMNLVYMGIDGFLLTVSNIESLKEVASDMRVFCFTDAGVDLLTKLEYYGVGGISNEFIFKPLQEGPGHYWCEGFRLSDMKPISSNVIFHRSLENFPNEYVIELTHIYKSDENPLSNTYFQDKVLSPEANQNSSSVFRLEKILNVDEKQSTIFMNVHISFKTPTENISIVKDQIDKAFLDVTLIKELRSSDFCIEEESYSLNWPRTPIGDRAYPKELCFQADGTLSTRSCKGDFSNGGHWEEVESSCEILEESSVTGYLLNLLYTEQEISDLKLEYISGNYSEFGIADICLVANIFDKLKLTSGNHTQCTFSTIINNLLEIDMFVLREAQRRFGAVNKILNLINLILGKQYKTDTYKTCEHDNANFHFTIITNSLATGVYTQEGDYFDPLQFLYQQTTIDEIKNIPNLQNAIFMTQNLTNQTNLFTKIIFTLFFKHSFFVSESPPVKITGPVFGFVIHKFNQNFQGPVQVVQKIKKYNDSQCLSWNYGTSAWQNISLSTYDDPLLLCKFWENGYFAFTTTQDDTGNVTECLIDILHSKANASEVITELHTISENYETFKSTDILLVGKILQKVHRDREIDLEILAKTVNNLHQINRDILLESQNHRSATDMVLNNVDKILKNHKYQKTVVTSNENKFMIFMFNIKETNFSGLVLVEEDDKVHIQVLTGDIEVDEIAKFNNFSNAVLLGPQLKNHLEDDAKIIITLFPNDAFFNEKNSYAKNISRIFGIILPSIEKYRGPITILHKINTSNSQEHCSYWKYSETLRGSWSKDHDGKDLSNLVRCDFWHTTHFALLLMDHEGKKDPVSEWINHVTCALSLVGLLIIVFTALIFERWRENVGNKVLLNFSIVDIAQIGLFYASAYVKESPEPSLWCTIIGVFLHYSVISQCCWMLVIAYLQYKRLVDVLGKLPQNILLKACLCGWGLPLFPALSVLAFQKDNYESNFVGLCYPSGWGLHLGVWLPVGTILIINFIVFVNIMLNIVCKKSDSVNAGPKEKILQCKMGFLLFFMLGLSSSLGLLCEFNLGDTFNYVVTIISNLQGFVLFLFFIAFNVSTRSLYTKAFKIHCSKMY